MLRAFLLCLLLAVPSAAAGQRRQLPPVDQCAADASFAAFRTSLLDAVARRDAAFVLSIITDDIMFNFGGGEGRRAFREAWSLDSPEASGLWTELGAVLRLGCARGGETMWAPAMFRQLDDLEDPTSAVVALGEGALVRAAPSEDSPVLARLDWDVLTWRSADAPEDWLPVALADGRAGFVRRAEVRSLLDYRAGFVRRGGRWRMHYFIAGD